MVDTLSVPCGGDRLRSNEPNAVIRSAPSSSSRCSQKGAGDEKPAASAHLLIQPLQPLQPLQLRQLPLPPLATQPPTAPLLPLAPQPPPAAPVARKPT